MKNNAQCAGCWLPKRPGFFDRALDSIGVSQRNSAHCVGCISDQLNRVVFNRARLPISVGRETLFGPKLLHVWIRPDKVGHSSFAGWAEGRFAYGIGRLECDWAVLVAVGGINDG